VNECKPLPVTAAASVFSHIAAGEATSAQGLTLVHFSAQLEPCLTQQNTLHIPNTPSHPLNTGYITPYVHPLSYTERSS
jgi:hypothetical protein